MSRPVVIAAVVAAAVAASVALAGCPGGQKKPDDGATAVAAPSLVGGWASSCFSMQNPDGTDGFGKLDFDLQAATWGVDLTFFADDGCASKVGTVHMDGPYVIERASTVLPGAYEARFDFGRRTVTAHVDGFIAFLQSMSCGKAPYAVGVAQDILDAGCPSMGFQPRATCPSDFDVVFVNGSSLQFGQRPNDNNMCTVDKRPKALGAPLTKVR